MDDKKYSTDISQTTLAPRFDLREPAFRKYERDIANAAHVPSLVITPPLNKTQHTYVCRLRDAILGYARYRYKSDLIPKDFDVTALVVRPTLDGRVLVTNRKYTEGVAVNWQNVRATEPDRIRALLRGVIDGSIKLSTHRCYVYYSGAAERDEVMKLLAAEFPDDADGVRDEGDRLAI